MIFHNYEFSTKLKNKFQRSLSMSNSEKQSKATKFLASYSCWDYKFNKKIRDK